MDDPASARPYLEIAAVHGDVEAAIDLLVLGLFRP